MLFCVYGVLYGYAGISDVLLRGVHEDTSIFGYLAVSATVVIVCLVVAARRFGRDA